MKKSYVISFILFFLVIEWCVIQVCYLKGYSDGDWRRKSEAIEILRTEKDATVDLVQKVVGKPDSIQTEWLEGDKQGGAKTVKGLRWLYYKKSLLPHEFVELIFEDDKLVKITHYDRIP